VYKGSESEDPGSLSFNTGETERKRRRKERRKVKKKQAEIERNK
jgi:hypothetical protein